MSTTARTSYPILLAALLWVATPLAQPQMAAGFSLYARALMNEGKEPSIKVSAHVPNTNLVFLKAGDVFEAKYRLYVRVFDATGKKLVDSAVIRKTVVAERYEDTRSNKNSTTVSHLFETGPGDYVVRCTVRVMQTHLSFSKEAVVTVPSVERSGVGLSRPRFFATRSDTSRNAPILTRIPREDRFSVEQKEHAALVAIDTQPAFQFDVFLEQPGPEPTRGFLIYEVVNREDSQVLYGRKRIDLAGFEDQFVVTFNVDDWYPGRYRINIKATIPDPPRATVSHLGFDVEFTRAMLHKEFDTTIAILSLIASTDEVEAFKEAPEEGRAALWAEFWRRRDPTPRTEENEALEEHWKRLRYVDENFGTNEAGWRTDRGKVYIRHGEPDHTEVQNDPYVQGEYLIWRYYQENLTFVFYDRFGLGEYRLSNTSSF